jgi:hypothetical protein
MNLLEIFLGHIQIMRMFASNGVQLDFTMLEMTDYDNPQSKSAPEELIKSVFADANTAGISE